MAAPAKTHCTIPCRWATPLANPLLLNHGQGNSRRRLASLAGLWHRGQTLLCHYCTWSGKIPTETIRQPLCLSHWKKGYYHNSNLHLPLALCPKTPPPPLISIHINAYQIMDTPTTLMVIPFTPQTPTWKPPPLAAAASSVEVSHTVQKLAWPVCSSMGSPYGSQNLPHQMFHAQTEMADNIASAGMGRTETAPSPNVLENMLAPYAVTRSIMPNPAPPCSSSLPIVTPFIADTWELLLRKQNLFDQFSDVPYSIHHGFNLGIHSIPAATYIPPLLFNTQRQY